MALVPVSVPASVPLAHQLYAVHHACLITDAGQQMDQDNVQGGRPHLLQALGRRLRAFACDDMLHAKVFSARSSARAAPDAAMVGSCNLKRRSFGQFAELNALIAQPSCTRQLRRELETLVGMSEEIFRGDPFLDFAEPKASVEEWLG